MPFRSETETTNAWNFDAPLELVGRLGGRGVSEIERDWPEEAEVCDTIGTVIRTPDAIMSDSSKRVMPLLCKVNWVSASPNHI